MTMTDPVADMLTRIRNASAAHLETTIMPHSKFKVAIASILKNEGYISDFKESKADVGKDITIVLKYTKDETPAIHGVKRVSKPGLRKYAKTTNLPKVFGGLGIAILSTSSGIMTDRQAQKKGVGGEVIAHVW
ncbi:MAG: 30S ribosomal protein S8 [Bifidobacteriaceae bacterium]|jgi:small subunit ribosomal protein S8|nr:30S ribosomal protein S8 [Bifidobacteriaceae bacterium]